jgi:hypothetical protein
MIRYLFLGALLFCVSAYAMDTYRFGNRLVEVGDAVSKLVDVGGEPVYKEPVENKFGAHEGERWQYKQEGGTVTFVIKDSKIASIEQTRN